MFELSAGPVRAVVHVAERCMFDGQQVQWHLEHGDEASDIVKLVGVCYRGESKAFAFDSLGETRIGIGLELLRDDQTPSQAIVTLTDAKTLPNREGTFYRLGWEPVTGDKGIAIPAQPMDK